MEDFLHVQDAKAYCMNSAKVKRYLLVLFSVLITLLLVELGFRVYYCFFDKNNYETLTEKLREKEYKKDVYRWDDLIRRSDSEYLIYELKSDFNGKVDFVYSNNIKNIIHNRDGLRGSKIYPYNKSKNIYKRIAVFGDSGIYGWGLDEDETYPKILEKKLNERYEGRYEFEVINFGVPGYQAIQTIEMFFYKGLKYNPDIVIVATYGLLDLDFGDFFYPRFSFFSPIPFSVFHFSKYLWKDFYYKTLISRYENKSWTNNYGYGKDNLQRYPQYEKWIGLENAKMHFLKLKNYTDKKKIYLLDLFTYFGNGWAYRKIFITPNKTATDPSERIKNTAEFGVKTIDGFLLVRDYLKDKPVSIVATLAKNRKGFKQWLKGILKKYFPEYYQSLRYGRDANSENKTPDNQLYLSSLCCVSERDPHPNAIANNLLAETTIEHLIKDRVIPNE